MKPLELWGGVECTVNRVENRYYNQLARSGHAGRLSDLDRIAELGIRTLRYPILWELNGPDLDVRGDWQWARQRLNALRTLDIVPIVGLVHHGSGPARTCLTDAGFASGLAAYARTVASQFPWVEWYTPVNEPLTTARFSGLYGLWYPHGRDNRTFARALINQCRATVLSMQAIREVNPRAKLLQTDDLGTTYSTAGMQYQADFDNERRWLGWDLLCGRVGQDHPMRSFLIESDVAVHELDWFCEQPCPPNMIGVNHYVTSDRFLDERFNRYPNRYWGTNAAERYADVEAVRVVDSRQSSWSTTLHDAWDRYHLPIALSEVHLGCTREEQLRWFAGAWHAAEDARNAGVDVVAVTAWSLFGSFDWDSLLTRDAGRYEPGVFDIRGAAPRPTALAHLIRELASGLRPTHPVLDSPGWWERSQRLLYRGESQASVDVPVERAPPTGGRPLLMWSGGRVEEIFSRVCEERGLPFQFGSLRSIKDPTAAAALIDQIQPWAMICIAHCLLGSCGKCAESCPQVAAQREVLRSLAEGKRIPLFILSAPGCTCSRLDAKNLVELTQATRLHPSAVDRGMLAVSVPDMDLERVANLALDLIIDRHQSRWHLTNDGQWLYVWRISTIACVR